MCILNSPGQLSYRIGMFMCEKREKERERERGREGERERERGEREREVVGELVSSALISNLLVKLGGGVFIKYAKESFQINVYER